MKFVASDGMVFDDFHLCEEYEASLSKHDCKCESCNCNKETEDSQLTKHGFVLYAVDGTIIPVNDIKNPARKKIKYVKISNTRTAFLALKNTFMYCGINNNGIDDVGEYVYCQGAWYSIAYKGMYKKDFDTMTEDFEFMKQKYEAEKLFYTDLLECIKNWEDINS